MVLRRAAAVALLCLPAAPGADTLHFSLEDYVAAVVARNQDIALRRIRVEQAAATVTEKRRSNPYSLATTYASSFSNQPSTDIADSVRVVKNDGSTLNATVSKKFITGTTVGVAYGYAFNSSNSRRVPETMRDYHSSNVNVSLSQPVLANLGNIFHQREVRAAESDHRVSALACRQSVEETVFKAVQVYFALLQLQRQIAIKEEGLANARTSLATVEELVRRKFEKEEKLMQGESQILEKQNELYALQNACQEKAFAFADLIDSLSADPVADLSTPPLTPAEDAFSIPFDTLYRRALEARPDYLQALESRRKAQLSLALTRSATLPSLDLTGNYYLYGTDPDFARTWERFGSNEFNRWSVGLTFSMPISPDYRANRLFPLRVAEREADRSADALAQKIRQELLAMTHRLRLACRQYATLENSLVLAGRNAARAETLYKKGFIGLAEYLEQKNGVETARFSLLKNEVEFTTGLYELKKTTGGLAGSFGITEKP